jgi:hypothetical protein
MHAANIEDLNCIHFASLVGRGRGGMDGDGNVRSVWINDWTDNPPAPRSAWLWTSTISDIVNVNRSTTNLLSVDSTDAGSERNSAQLLINVTALQEAIVPKSWSAWVRTFRSIPNQGLLPWVREDTGGSATAAAGFFGLLAPSPFAFCCCFVAAVIDDEDKGGELFPAVPLEPSVVELSEGGDKGPDEGKGGCTVKSRAKFGNSFSMMVCMLWIMLCKCLWNELESNAMDDGRSERDSGIDNFAIDEVAPIEGDVTDAIALLRAFRDAIIDPNTSSWTWLLPR